MAQQPWGRVTGDSWGQLGPRPAGRGPSMPDAKRDMQMAKMLMGYSMQQPQNNYLQPIANMASMLAFAQADKGYDEAQIAARQARTDRFGTALDSMAPELGAERVAMLRGMLDPNAEDPVQDVTRLMGAFNATDRTRIARDAAARRGSGGGTGTSSGGRFSASILSEARRMAEANPRYLDMTPEQQIAYVRDLAAQITTGAAPSVDPEGFFPEDADPAEGRSWGEWWNETIMGNSPAPAAETPASTSDPVQGPATALAAPAPVSPSTPATPAAPSRPGIPAPPAPPRPQAPATSPAGMPRVTSDADYEALPPGTRFIDPEGNVRVKG